MRSGLGLGTAPRTVVAKRAFRRFPAPPVRVNSILGGWKSATDAGNRGKLVFQVFVVLVAGCLSVIPSELIVKKDPQGFQAASRGFSTDSVADP